MAATVLNVDVLPTLPDIFGRGDPVPPGLEGSTVLRFGAPAERRGLEGGGLVIDYRKPDGSEHRVVFHLNDCALWVATATDPEVLATATDPDAAPR